MSKKDEIENKKGQTLQEGLGWTTGPKGFGPGLRAIFANPDNYLCNDCDRIQKECECPASIKEE